jgi:hypothetical protein
MVRVRTRAAVVFALAIGACSHSTASSGSEDASASAADAITASGPDASTAHCALIILSFEGTVATVSGTPLGLDSSIRTSSVTGHFSYDPCVPAVTMSMDHRRAEYSEGPIADGAFALVVGPRHVTGSGRPLIDIENLDPDTFRFKDGPQLADPTPRIMSVDGQPNIKVELVIAITDSSGAAFSNDDLPTSFPFLNIATFPHTFSIMDDKGTLLLQLRSLSQMMGS